MVSVLTNDLHYDYYYSIVSVGTSRHISIIMLHLSFLQTGQWAVRVKGKHPNLYFYTCPPGYCQCFFNTSIGPTACVHVYSNTQPDRQCGCDRKGTNERLYLFLFSQNI